MAKSKTKRLAIILLVLTLITSAFVGGAYAKYVTEANGLDSARVAKFGVQVKAGQDLFAEKYAKDDTSFNYDGEFSVVAFNNTDELVAPGTKGTMELFNISGTPEVAVNVKATLNKGGNTLKMVTLPSGDYTDYTVCQADGTYSATFNNGEDYFPVVWTLKHDDAQVVTGNLAAINTYLENTFSKNYDPNTGLNAINGSWDLDWAWDYADQDQQDTYLGNVAAGIKTDATALLTEAFSFNITVTQID